MNKIFRLIGIIVIAIYSMAANAESITIDDITYETDPQKSNAVILTNGRAKSGDVVIPCNVTIGEKVYIVTTIGSSSFSYSKIKTIEIPEGVERIEMYAFSGCSQLTLVQLPSTLTTIETSAFSSTAISDIYIRERVSEIGNEAFRNCDNLSSIVVEEGNGTYDSRNNCNAVIRKSDNVLIQGCKSSIVPSGVTAIGEYAFSGSPIEQLVLPSSIKYICKWSFSYSKIKTIEIPEGVEKIERYAFSNCSQLTSVRLPSTLTTIETSAFSSTAISDIYIRERVSEIGNEAFRNCDNLLSIVVEEGNGTYDSRNNCNAIIRKSDNVLIQGCKSSIVPSGVTAIGEYAFSGSPIEQLVLPSSIKYICSWSFSYSKIKTIEIPEGVEKIERYAFADCNQLTLVQLPSTLTTIETSAFSSCDLLLDIVSKKEEPFSIDDNVFNNYNGTIYSNAILSVPSPEAVVKYQNTDGWKKFANIQVIEPDPTPQINNIIYVIHKKAKYAEIQSVTEEEHVVIPESVEYEGNNYPVTRILDDAFKGSDMISLSIPNSITYVGQNVIKDCGKLAAIVWNPKFKPSGEFVGLIVNQNLLFYVTEEQYKPDGIKNIVIGEQANSITLADETYGDFYCPRPFTASNITYTHNYSLPTEKGWAQGWESIVLPFKVQTIKTASSEIIKPVSVADTGEKRFWLRELKENGLEEVAELKANVPYIISMPNWDGYQDFYNITGEVTFSAQNVTVEPSGDIQPSISGPYQFVPNYQAQKKQDSIWALNTEEFVEKSTTYAPGSVFRAGLRDVRPFEAYLTTSSSAVKRMVSISDILDVTTSFIDIPSVSERIYFDNRNLIIESSTSCNCDIYSLSGQLVRTVALTMGTNTVSGLTKGVYIVNGQKVFIR